MNERWLRLDEKKREATILRRPNGLHTYLALRELRKQGYTIIDQTSDEPR